VEFDGRRKLSLLFDIKEWLQENALLPLKETNFSGLYGLYGCMTISGVLDSVV
jgi:hypothetical protein